ncbi:MAG: cation transporter, partial [Pseudomonadales bacterium]
TRLFTLEQYETPTWPGLLVALISIAGKEWLYQITARLGKKTNSRLLQANAWHHRTDALSSILVFIGIGAALVGYPWLELV